MTILQDYMEQQARPAKAAFLFVTPTHTPQLCWKIQYRPSEIQCSSTTSLKSEMVKMIDRPLLLLMFYETKLVTHGLGKSDTWKVDAAAAAAQRHTNVANGPKALAKFAQVNPIWCASEGSTRLRWWYKSLSLPVCLSVSVKTLKRDKLHPASLYLSLSVSIFHVNSSKGKQFTHTRTY